ncbi:hypothetical protein PYJP_03150 [Pyrofollis japonicus]|uniref:hypothetical protein n=1 Tax=Pyrofollis japonicus TaxID=3060460 RepID=UPI00295B53AE|nr:hypothetical protein [Pyrofollis japonicus]BEP16963.1 hypothetical protein PYJP_03150 [Pyrofollis japonicus]
MSNNSGFSLELVEKYELLGEKRFRFRIKGTSLYINVSAENEDEALKKAMQMVKELELDKLVTEIFKK